MNSTGRLLLTLAVTAGLACAQSMISAKSGLINYVEGEALLDGKRVELKFGNFPQISENSTLQTKDGRAEVLLTPGVFLRLAENSSMRMVANRLSDTQVELLSGTAMIEAPQLLKDNAITVVSNGATAHLKKNGIYRFETEPARIRTYEGELAVEVAGQNLPLKKGRELIPNGALVAEKFDTKTGDALSRWSKRRAEYIAMANISAAKTIRDRGLSWQSSGWAWNPYFGLFTFVPYRGGFSDFYGFRYWSPRSVYDLYAAPVYRGGGRVYSPERSSGSGSGVYTRVPQTSTGHSGTMATAAPRTTAPSSSSSAPIPRSSGGSAGGGRHR